MLRACGCLFAGCCLPLLTQNLLFYEVRYDYEDLTMAPCVMQVLGVQLFSGRFNFNDGLPSANFDNFWTAFLTMYQVCAAEAPKVHACVFMYKVASDIEAAITGA